MKKVYLHPPALLMTALAASFACSPAPPAPSHDSTVTDSPSAEAGRAVSADGVPIAYTSYGSGETALVFVHGGYADQTFWKHQTEALADRFRVVTLDLAGHGLSGSERVDWTMSAFGEDVRAVVAALELESVILVGNSLGGPVSLEAASKLPDSVLGIVAVDTFQAILHHASSEELEAYVQTFRDDFGTACAAMMDGLMVEGTDPELFAWVEQKMCGFDPEIAPNIVASFFGYELAEAFTAAQTPVRAILGEIIPLDLEGNRTLRPDFDAVVMEGCGHYPMLDRPEEFNQHLLAWVEKLSAW